MRQAIDLRLNALTNYDTFRLLCSEASTPFSMSQSIRALTNRLNLVFGAPENWPIRVRIRSEDEMPHMELKNISFSQGSTLSTCPSLSTLSETSSRNYSSRFMSSSTIYKSPSLIFSPKMFLNRRFKKSSRLIEEDTTSSLSIDMLGSLSIKENVASSSNLLRRPSIHSSTSSISSLSLSRVDRMKKAVTEFESVSYFLI